MLDNIYQIPHEKSLAIEWQGNDLHYDLQLYELGQGYAEFFVINPNNNIPEKWETDLKYYVEELPDTRKCTVIAHEGDWIVKICLLYTSPSPRDRQKSRMPSSA